MAQPATRPAEPGPSSFRRAGAAFYTIGRVERTLIADLGAKVGETVRLRGWVNAVRDQKRMQFLILRDETGLAQVVLEKPDPPSELNERISELTDESAVTLTGEVVADERVRLGGVEIRLHDFAVDWSSVVARSRRTMSSGIGPARAGRSSSALAARRSPRCPVSREQ